MVLIEKGTFYVSIENHPSLGDAMTNYASPHAT